MECPPLSRGLYAFDKWRRELLWPRPPVRCAKEGAPRLSDVENEQHGLLLGAVDHITKPFHSLVVKARVDTHIKMYNYCRQAERQSLTDQLTGVANRRRYEHYSLMKWQEAVRLQVPFSKIGRAHV